MKKKRVHSRFSSFYYISFIILIFFIEACKKEEKLEMPITISDELIIDDKGIVTTIAGSGVVGNTNGQGTAATFYYPDAIAVDDSGNLYVADCYNHLIRKITASGIVTTLAGSGIPGKADGMGTSASFNYPRGIEVDDSGNVYVADYWNFLIRKINRFGLVTTVAGNGSMGNSDGTGTSASFSGPIGIAVDASGTIFVGDMGCSLIKKISVTGVVSTLAGSSGNNSIGNEDGLGASARFNGPQGLALDAFGNLYVADNGNHVIRKITSAGQVSTFAGTGLIGNRDGIASEASFSSPRDLALDIAGNLYVADIGSHKIRKITPSGFVSTLAGSINANNNDGVGVLAGFNWPAGVAVDNFGNVFVADEFNNLIRKITQ